MSTGYRARIFLMLLVMMMGLVVAACGEDSGSDDAAGSDGGSENTTEETDSESEGDSEDEGSSESESGSDSESTPESDESAEGEGTPEGESTPEAAGTAEGTADYKDATETANVNEALGGPITFGDFNWASAIFHNRVAQYIIENGYGFKTDEIAGSTHPMLQGLRDNDVQVVTEMWVQNMPDSYHEGVESGEYVDLGPNYVEALQGWFVPTYMIEGDEERGIEPMAPDLQSVEDLPQYADLFEDPEDPDKGRIYNGVGGWEATLLNDTRLVTYGLDEHFNSFLPGSQAALFTSLARAYEQGEPWIGYLWQPSWPFAQYDMTFIEEPEYTPECWATLQEAAANGEAPEEACGFPAVDVNVVVSPEFHEAAPGLSAFLTNYHSNMELTNAALLYINENDADPAQAAEWWLQEYPDVWTEWVPEDVAQKVQDSLAE